MRCGSRAWSVGDGGVGVAVQAQEADGQAAQCCHDAGCVSCSDQGLVLLLGDDVDPVELCFLYASGHGSRRQGGRADAAVAGDEVDDLDGLCLFRDGVAYLGGAGEVIRAGASATLMVRPALPPLGKEGPPWPRIVRTWTTWPTVVPTSPSDTHALAAIRTKVALSHRVGIAK